MIVSVELRPIASSRVQPNVASAWAFHVTMRPAESMPMNASCAVSTTEPRPRLAFGQPVQRRAAFLVGHRRDDEVRGRDGEVLLVDRPRAGGRRRARRTARRPSRCRWRNGTSSIAPMPCAAR